MAIVVAARLPPMPICLYPDVVVGLGIADVALGPWLRSRVSAAIIVSTAVWIDLGPCTTRQLVIAILDGLTLQLHHLAWFNSSEDTARDSHWPVTVFWARDNPYGLHIINERNLNSHNVIVVNDNLKVPNTDML